MAFQLSYRRAMSLFVILGAMVLTGFEVEASSAQAGKRSPALQLRSKKSGQAIRKKNGKKKSAHHRKKMKAKKRTAHVPSHVPKVLPPKKVTTVELPALTAENPPL